VDSRPSDSAVELVQRVQAAIADLPAAYREVLVLRDLDGMSGEEVAIALGLQLPAMKSRLLRARTRLRESLRVPARPSYESEP
jgi:RNA polymerase sigma-70 factor (ECF subfamily)